MKNSLLQCFLHVLINNLFDVKLVFRCATKCFILRDEFTARVRDKKSSLPILDKVDVALQLKENSSCKHLTQSTGVTHIQTHTCKPDKDDEKTERKRERKNKAEFSFCGKSKKMFFKNLRR